MEIEFNPRQYPKPGVSQPVTRQPATSQAQEAAPFARSQALENAVTQAPTVRPEKVEQARAMIADKSYPPEELVSRIASLLAMHVAKK